MAISGPVPNVTRKTLHNAIQEFVAHGTAMCTDDAAQYKGIISNHYSVNHSRREYVRREPDGFLAHTNTVESYFALFRRGHYGVYHIMSKGHLHLYCSEFNFRWNHRKVSDADRREAAFRQAPGKRLKYKTSA